MPITDFVTFSIIEPFEDTIVEILKENGLRLIYVFEGSKSLRDFEICRDNQSLHVDFDKKVHIEDDLFSYYVLGINKRAGLVADLELWLRNELIESRQLSF